MKKVDDILCKIKATSNHIFENLTAIYNDLYTKVWIL